MSGLPKNLWIIAGSAMLFILLGGVWAIIKEAKHPQNEGNVRDMPPIGEVAGDPQDNEVDDLAGENTPLPKVRIEDGTYIDEGLGFAFEIPSNWQLLPYERTEIRQARQDKIILQKGAARTLIDPLGRMGADSTGGLPVVNTDLVINGVEWRHSWIEGLQYHRYTAVFTEDFKLKSDPSTDGTNYLGRTYSGGRSFRVHLNLDDVADARAKEEAVEVIKSIIRSLSII